MVKTSLIVNVYNRAELLRVCLDAVLQQATRPDEVIVADDGSAPDQVAAIESLLASYPIPSEYAWQEDRGFRAAAARNMGIRKASGDYLVFLDCDIMLMPDAVASHLARSRPGTFVLGHVAFLPESSTRELLDMASLSEADMQAAWGRADRSHLPAAQRRFVKNRLLRRLHLTKRHKPQLLSGHFSIFKHDIERVNGFDEAYEGWGLEDDDLGIRLYQAGMRVDSVFREARAVHLWHTTHKPERGRGSSPNQDYFHRATIPTYCARGLKQDS